MPEFARSTNESPQPATSAPSAGSKSGRAFENEDVDVLANAADGSFLELVMNRSRGPLAPSTATPMPAYGSATPEAAARFSNRKPRPAGSAFAPPGHGTLTYSWFGSSSFAT